MCSNPLQGRFSLRLSFSTTPIPAFINAMVAWIVFHLVAEATTTKLVACIAHAIFGHFRREDVDGFVVIENNTENL